MNNQYEIDNTRLRILAAAKNHFLQNGYDKTRLEDIVREAKVSKTAIYKIFGGKSELFLALNELMLDELINSIKKCGPMNNPTIDDIRETLTNFGINYVRTISEPDSVAITRLNISIAKRFKKAAQNYYFSGPRVVEKMLTDYFRRMTSTGLLKMTDCETSANLFAALVRGNDHYRTLLDAEFERDTDQVAKQIDEAVTMFLKAYSTET